MSTTRNSIAVALRRAVRSALPVIGVGLLANVAWAQVPQLPLTPQAPGVPAPNVPAPGDKAPDVKLPEVNPPKTPDTPATPATPTIPATPKLNDPVEIPPPPSAESNKPQPNRTNDPAYNVDPLNRKAVDVNIQNETTVKGTVDAQGRAGATVNSQSAPVIRDNINVRERTVIDPNLRNVNPSVRGNANVQRRTFNDGRSYFYDPSGNFYYDGRGNYFYDGRWTNVVPPQSSTMAQSTTVTQRGKLGVTIVTQNGHLFVNEVFQGTPAAQAGLQPNDELVAINGQRIRSYNELLALLDNASRSNGQASIDFQRNGRIERVSVALAGNNTYPAYSGRTETYYRGPYQNSRAPNYNYNNWQNDNNGWNQYIPGRNYRGRGGRGRW